MAATALAAGLDDMAPRAMPAPSVRDRDLLELLLSGRHVVTNQGAAADLLLETLGTTPRVLAAWPGRLASTCNLPEDATAVLKAAEALGPSPQPMRQKEPVPVRHGLVHRILEIDCRSVGQLDFKTVNVETAVEILRERALMLPGLLDLSGSSETPSVLGRVAHHLKVSEFRAACPDLCMKGVQSGKPETHRMLIVDEIAKTPGLHRTISRQLPVQTVFPESL